MLVAVVAGIVDVFETVLEAGLETGLEVGPVPPTKFEVKAAIERAARWAAQASAIAEPAVAWISAHVDVDPSS